MIIDQTHQDRVKMVLLTHLNHIKSPLHTKDLFLKHLFLVVFPLDLFRTLSAILRQQRCRILVGTSRHELEEDQE